MSTTVADHGTLARWCADPVAFIADALRNPETGQPFILFEPQVRFLREAFTLTPDGRLPYRDLLFSAPKKSGKTALGAWALLYAVVVLGGSFGEGYTIANDEEQSVGRVFRAAARMVEASPVLRASARIYTDRIEFPGSGATVTALASDYAGAAGANPTLTVFDELWAYSGERFQRLWDEMVPVPTRQVSARLTVSYAGFAGESTVLESLYRRGLKGEAIAPALYRQPGSFLMFWTHEPIAPWQTAAWIEEMRGTLRTNAFLRMVENRFVTTESLFAPLEEWDACTDPEARPVIADGTLPVWVGVDASWKHDSTAVVVCAWDAATGRVRVVAHKTFQPSPDDPLDFEQVLEAHLLDLRERFLLRAVWFDPLQMINSAQRLARVGLPMVEFSQTVPNLIEASTALYDLIRGRNLVVYPADDLRLAISRAVGIETSRGVRIAKEKAAHKIDVVVALAMAALPTVREGPSRPIDLRRDVLLGPRRLTAQAFGQAAREFDWLAGAAKVRQRWEDLP